MSGRSLLVLMLAGGWFLTAAGHASTPVPVITIYVDPGQRAIFTAWSGRGLPAFDVVPVIPIAALEARLSADLPNREAAARPVALARVRAAQAQLNDAWAQALTLKRLEITHLPAIVFNHGQAVWYGVRLADAVDAFYRRQRP